MPASPSLSPTIRYSLAPCEVGLVLVARTSRGVCCVALGHDARELELQLSRDFSPALIERDDAALRDDIAQVLASLRGERAFPDLELDVRATPFQRKVWQELQRIPRGQTITYSLLAERVGNPKAVRAVASACGRNPVALVYPCHRVVGKNGSLAGFRWQIERKQRLLELERR